jgi:hypothetical protein
MTKPLAVVQGGRPLLAAEPGDAALTFGPARVVGSPAPGFVDVEAVGSERPPLRAALAFAQPYQPAEGDVLLIAGRGDDVYAIGVIRGTGRAVLDVEGDLDVRASGKLRLVGERGVEVTGPEIDLTADKLRTVARAATQTFQTLLQKVSGLLTTQARTTHTQVEEGATTRAKHVAILTEDEVVVNGKQLFLG